MTAAIFRRTIPLLFALGLHLGAAASSEACARPLSARPEALSDGIAVGSSSSENLDPARIAKGIGEIEKGAYGNIHSLLIFRHGKLVSESYFSGEDENNHQGKIGFVRHSRETLHDVRSVSKTIVALAVLMAHHNGQIRSLDQPIFDYFPDYARDYSLGAKAKITLKHALTMTAGLDWNEEVPYAHPANTPAQFKKAPDALAFVLGRDLVELPGTKFNYNGGLTQLLAAIVKRSTGKNVAEYTREHLFSPLGIRTFEWAKRDDGEPDADSGLRLRSRDMAKIGLFLANRGRWGRKRILPTNLVDEALSAHVQIPQEGEAAALGDRQAYGYQVWRFSFLAEGERIELKELSGNGGQKVYIDDANRLMVVITAGNYDRRGLKKTPLDIYTDIVLPAVHDR